MYLPTKHCAFFVCSNWVVRTVCVTVTTTISQAPHTEYIFYYYYLLLKNNRKNLHNNQMRKFTLSTSQRRGRFLNAAKKVNYCLIPVIIFIIHQFLSCFFLWIKYRKKLLFIESKSKEHYPAFFLVTRHISKAFAAPQLLFVVYIDFTKPWLYLYIWCKEIDYLYCINIPIVTK